MTARRRFALLLALIATGFVISTHVLFTVGTPRDVTLGIIRLGARLRVMPVFVAFATLTGACIATGMMSAPVLFVCAAWRRSRWARAAGVALCIALVPAQAALLPRGYWPHGWTNTVTPALAHWYAVPVLFAVAFALLPLGKETRVTPR